MQLWILFNWLWIEHVVRGDLSSHQANGCKALGLKHIFLSYHPEHSLQQMHLKSASFIAPLPQVVHPYLLAGIVTIKPSMPQMIWQNLLFSGDWTRGRLVVGRMVRPFSPCARPQLPLPRCDRQEQEEPRPPQPPHRRPHHHHRARHPQHPQVNWMNWVNWMNLIN